MGGQTWWSMNHSATQRPTKNWHFRKLGIFHRVADTEKNRNTINQKYTSKLTFVKSEELTELEGEKNAWFLNCSHNSPKGSGFCTVASATSAMKKIPSINPLLLHKLMHFTKRAVRAYNSGSTQSVALALLHTKKKVGPKSDQLPKDDKMINFVLK